ncbi:glycoside hydrolase [Purpureocillium lavendulum]|uniref:Glycoside hydrolase n=1 Tax=Purpureocillium lavendulum TaxID=1247861 RepID=A0AB34G0B1_9HYPO|nr:glycoside hydrolase [Purpureocillium lavendulum]
MAGPISAAPLEGVLALQLFEVLGKFGSTRRKGMILKYRDGRRRALGECRVGVDPAKEYTWPMELWLPDQGRHKSSYPVSSYFDISIVDESSPLELGCDQPDYWRRYEMRGTLELCTIKGWSLKL